VGAAETDRQIIQKVTILWRSGSTLSTRSGSNDFAFGCLVYNLWLLVDFLTQERIGVIETRKKPRITLSRFLEFLKKELVTLL